MAIITCTSEGHLTKAHHDRLLVMMKMVLGINDMALIEKGEQGLCCSE